MDNNYSNPNGGSSWQWSVTAVVIIIILVVIGYMVFKKSPDGSDTINTNNPATSQEENRLIVNDQFPGNIVYVATVQLAKTGFVSVRKSTAGAPGAAIGTKLFEKGTNSGNVTLGENTIDGMSYYAVLYDDTDGDRIFDETKDQPIRDKAGNIIMKMFRALSDLVETKG